MLKSQLLNRIIQSSSSVYRQINPMQFNMGILARNNFALRNHDIVGFSGSSSKLLLPPTMNSIVRPISSRAFTTNALFTPYKIDSSTYEQIQEGTYALHKRSPLAADVLSRIEIEGMSLGSISPTTHGHIAATIKALAGVKTHEELVHKLYKVGLLTTSNCGEGGDLNEHLVKQIASGRFGVTLDLVLEAAVLQFKAAQGVKPGVGGALSGIKVNELIAFLRHCEPWTDLFSPGPHHDQYSIEDFAQIVKDYSVKPNVGWSTKLASEPDVGTIAVGVAKAMGLSEQGRHNNIVITGQGATGNAPLFTKYHVVFPWLVGLANTHWKLTQAGIRHNVTLTASGGFVGSFFDAFLWGADKVGIGTLALIADGCIMVRKCHDNTCPTGVATLNPTLMTKNTGSPLTIARVLWAAAELTALEMQPYFDTVEQAIGRAADILVADKEGPLSGHEKYLDRLKALPRNIPLGQLPRQQGPSYREREIIEQIRSHSTTEFIIPAHNYDLSFGKRLNYFAKKDPSVKEIVETQGVTIRFEGLATGQSLAVLGAQKITFDASETHTNDGTGKSLSGADVYAATCGNQAGFAMTDGLLATMGVGSRGAVRQSGGVFITEYAGPFFANFKTAGRTYLLGNPSHYPNLTAENYRQPFAFKQQALGFGFLSGFSGGKIFLPSSLWKEALALNHVSPTIRNQITPSPLNEEDKKHFYQDLEKSTRQLNSPLQKALLLAITFHPELINQWLIKLEAPRPKFQQMELVNSGSIVLAEEKLSLPEIDHSLKTKNKNIGQMAILENADMVMPPDRERSACGTGLIMDLDGKASHEKLQMATIALQRLEHRGAGSIDPLASDGCGILLVFGSGFFEAQPEFKHLNLKLGQFGVITIFMPKNIDDFQATEKVLQKSLTSFGMNFAAKRVVPTNEDKLGIQAKADKLKLMQYIVLKPSDQSSLDFDRQLSLAHLNFEFTAQQMDIPNKGHCCSASRRFVIYKTKGKEKYITDIYPDLKNSLFTIFVALIHSRFATNTGTLIENVQPLMTAMFNGEINNLRRFIESVKYDRPFSELVGVDLRKFDFTRYSDSAIMAIYMKMLQLKGYSSEQIHHAIFHPYSPTNTDPISTWHNLMGIPGLEGPNASIRIFEEGETFNIMVEMDTMGWRPHRGILDVNRRLLVTGSELGIVPELSGDLIELGPGEALDIDPLKGSCQLFQATPETIQEYTSKLAAISECQPSKSYENSSLSVGLDNLEERKLRAGLSAEIEKTILQPMFNNGNGFTVSMGDDGSPEVTVSGPTRIIYAIKTNFAQITRPPLDYLREGEVMSGRTFIGARPNIENLHSDKPQGLYVENPILDNYQMKMMLETNLFKSKVIDITYRVCERESAMLSALDRVCKACIECAEQDIALIVLSDMNTDSEYASLLPMIVAGAVNLALVKAGLRHKVTLCLQSAIAVTPLEQVTAIALGIDIINPYLIFALALTSSYLNQETFIQKCDSYRKIALKEILAASARAGIRTLSGGYRRASQVMALGLDKEVADCIGIYSELGGFDWPNIAAASVDVHIRPSNIGKFENTGQTARIGKWNVALVNYWRMIAKGEKTVTELLPDMKQIMNASRQDNLEGWFKKKPPQKWTADNPMTVIIVGGGAAGFLQAQALLNSPMRAKIRIKMLEENPANLFGLVKDGIAPDKKAAKEFQFKLLGQCLSDKHFEYYGGVTVGADGDVKSEDLTRHYPLVIDCRGAPQDKKLTDVDGHHLFISARKVWKAYNGYFDPFNPDRYWPFRKHSRYQGINVIGNGNVAADIIRLLLARADNSDGIDMHPMFQEHVRKQGPRFIRNFARGSVLQCKITLKELESFEKNGISVYADFDEQDIVETELTEEQQRKLEFFRKAKMKQPSLTDGPRVHFHFGCSTKKAYLIGRNTLEMEIEHSNGKVERYRPSDIITAVGMEQPEEELQTQFVAGWASGNGGNLSIIEKTVAKNTAKILTLDESHHFDHKMGPASEQPWQLMAAVTNQGFLNILKYRQEGYPLNTTEDWRKARDYSSSSSNIFDTAPATVDSSSNFIANSTIKADELAVQDPSKREIVISTRGFATTTIYRLLKEKAKSDPKVPVPENDCDESGNCMRCVAEVASPKNPIKQNLLSKTKLVTLFGSQSAKNKMLTCQQETQSVLESSNTIVVMHPLKQK